MSSFQQVSSGGQDFAPPRVAQAPPVSSSVHSEEPSALLFSDTLLPVQRALGAEEGPVSMVSGCVSFLLMSFAVCVV